MNILLGISGGIAAYKTPSIISVLNQSFHNVMTVMSPSSHDFVTEMSIATMSGFPVITTLQNEKCGVVQHIEIAKWCDVFVVCPATANIIGKMANGIADDALSTIHLAIPSGKKIKICPAMNTNMYKNPIVQKNINTLENLGYWILEPDSGKLACGDFGEGKLPSTKKVVDFILADNILEIT